MTRLIDRMPALPNHLISATGKAYQIPKGEAPREYVRLMKAVRLADALMARAQFRAVRLPSIDACTDYMLAADAGHVKGYSCMGGLPRLPGFDL